ncbi:UNVERIFIED_CONTAM: hypothetical protein FKN15_071368 [Acipenser sinensis]
MFGLQILFTRRSRKSLRQGFLSALSVCVVLLPSSGSCISRLIAFSAVSMTTEHCYSSKFEKLIIMSPLCSTVDVTLDPDTAQPELTLSAEGKRARWGETRQDLHDNPERFDVWRCVLGRESFTSGRRYWQVQVGGNTAWILGVSRESAERKGWFSMTPQQGYWTVQWSGGGFTALTDPRTPLPRNLKTQKLGV